jgi:hypothetical protein
MIGLVLLSYLPIMILRELTGIVYRPKQRLFTGDELVRFSFNATDSSGAVTLKLTLENITREVA